MAMHEVWSQIAKALITEKWKKFRHLFWAMQY